MDRLNFVSHGPIAPLPFFPHAGQLGLIGFNVIVDAYIFLVHMFPMQAACVLLERSFPGDRHGQYECIQGRMIKAFADQATCGKNDTGCAFGKIVQFGEKDFALLFRNAAMQHKAIFDGSAKGFLQQMEMVSPFGEDQDFASLLIGGQYADSGQHHWQYGGISFGWVNQKGLLTWIDIWV